MKFIETPLAGAYVIELEEIEDDRGFFSRAFCADELEERGLNGHVAQMNLSGNNRAGTFRGLHWQDPPFGEVKIFRNVRGATYHTIVDMRADSPTRRQWFGVELTAENHRALYVPEQFANGYLALSDGAEALYTVSQKYAPGNERGVRVDDPALGIELPIAASIRTEKDESWPLLD